MSKYVVIHEFVVETVDGEVKIQLVRNDEDRLDIRPMPKLNGRFYATRTVVVSGKAWSQIIAAMVQDPVMSEHLSGALQNRLKGMKKVSVADAA